MDLGVGLPTSYPLASPEAILRIAQEAEDLGYAAVWAFVSSLLCFRPETHWA